MTLFRIHNVVGKPSDLTYPMWYGLVTEVEAAMAGQAAVLFSKAGWRGNCTLTDAYGNSTDWDLHAIEIPYAYPILPKFQIETS